MCIHKIHMCLHIVATQVHTLSLYPEGCARVLETGVMSSNLSSWMLALAVSLLPQLKNLIFSQWMKNSLQTIKPEYVCKP